MKRIEDIADKRWLTISRVSSPGQERGPSLESQGDQVESTMNRADGDRVEHIQSSESATTLERETIENIVRKAEADEYDILGIPTLDRLTRADPWESIDLMRTLHDNGIIICASDYGPYDWNDLNDFRKLANDIAFSREIVNKIREGMKRGFKRRLEARRWPFSTEAPAGFKLGDERKLHLKEGAEEVIPAIFEYYVEEESIRGAHERINEEVLPKGDIDELSNSQIGAILSNRIFLGELQYDDEVYGQFDEFELVTETEFEEAATIRRKNDPTVRSEEAIQGPMESLDNVEEHAMRFGPHYTFLDILGQFVPLCGDCGARLSWDEKSTGTALGVTVPRFKCEGCGNERNIPDNEELRAMHQVLPYRCPYCPGTEEFTVRPIRKDGAKFDYLHECEICGHSWGSNMSCNQLQRFLDHPQLGFSLNDESPGEYNPPEEDLQQELIGFTDEAAK